MLLAWSSLDATHKKVALSSVIIISLIYGICLWLGCFTMRTNRAASTLSYRARMNPNGVEAGQTPPEPLPAQGNFVNVKVGTYIDDIDAFSIKDSNWSANFYLWFLWTGPRELDPGSKVVIVDGTITKKDLLENRTTADGVNYQKYRMSAKFLKFFDTSRVPLESHMLNIYIEDGARDASKLRFVADPSSNISSRIKIPGFNILRTANVVKAHTYRSSYGDPNVAEGQRKTYSQYVLGVNIARSSFGLYVKIFLSLFAALVLALSNFFVKPSDVGPRFSLPSAAFFGAVANSYVANSLLPPSGDFGLVDWVAGFGLGTIFLTIALALTSNYLFVKKGEQALALVIDRLMFFTVGGWVVVANLVLPLCARG